MKKYLYILLLLFASATFPPGLFGQNLSVSGQAALQTLVSNSERQPFYFWANQLGQVSATEQFQLFTHISAKAAYRLQNENQHFFAGLNTNLNQTRNTAVNLPELYGGFQAKYFQITAGLFSDSVRLAGLSPSNSNFMVTRNAPPIPRLRLGTNRFIRFWEKDFFVAALFEEGLLNDNRWVKQAKLHHKNLYLRLGNPEKIEITAGLDHFIFWGGHTAEIQHIPGLKYYIRTILGRNYFDESLGFMNTIGNQLGQYQLMLRKSFPAATGTFQISHIFEDASGVNFMNYPDNIYTLFLEPKNSPFVKNVLLEYTYTKHQSGPLIDPKTGAYRPSSGDSYFSHSHYRSGFTYKGYFIGTPLFGPILYTEEGIPNGPANNRFSAIHLGLSGNLFSSVEYKIMGTHSQNFGRWSEQSETPLNQFFSMASVRYTFPARQNVYAEGQVAFDSGSLWIGEHATISGINVNLGIKF